MKVLLAVGLFISLIMIYAIFTQLMLLTKNPKRGYWAISTIIAAAFLPPMLLAILGIHAYKMPTLWLFTSYSWAGISEVATTTIFMALLGHLSILTLLTFQLTRQAKLAGESATKALLAGR